MTQPPTPAFPKVRPLPRLDRRACFAHQRIDEIHVVMREQARPEHLLAAEEMGEIRAREGRAGVAVAARIDRREIAREGGIEEVELAVVSHRASVASTARRVDAVEEIQPGIDRFQKVANGPDAHEIAGLLFRKYRRRYACGRVHLLARLADGESTDRVPRKIERHQLARAALSQRRL